MKLIITVCLIVVVASVGVFYDMAPPAKEAIRRQYPDMVFSYKMNFDEPNLVHVLFNKSNESSSCIAYVALGHYKDAKYIKISDDKGKILKYTVVDHHVHKKEGNYTMAGKVLAVPNTELNSLDQNNLTFELLDPQNKQLGLALKPLKKNVISYGSSKGFFIKLKERRGGRKDSSRRRNSGEKRGQRPE